MLLDGQRLFDRCSMRDAGSDVELAESADSSAERRARQPSDTTRATHRWSCVSISHGRHADCLVREIRLTCRLALEYEWTHRRAPIVTRLRWFAALCTLGICALQTSLIEKCHSGCKRRQTSSYLSTDRVRRDGRPSVWIDEKIGERMSANHPPAAHVAQADKKSDRLQHGSLGARLRVARAPGCFDTQAWRRTRQVRQRRERLTKEDARL